MALRLIPRLHRATHQVAIHLDREKERCPVTQAEAHVLSFLSERGGSGSMADLHRSFGHKRSTLTSIVDRLEKRGLVERTIHPDDRRSFMLKLTREGAVLARRIRTTLERLEARVLERLDPSDVRAFTAVLEAIEQAVEEARP
jgi:DNA-binding MarR family transcriptional regulator